MNLWAPSTALKDFLDLFFKTLAVICENFYGWTLPFFLPFLYPSGFFLKSTSI